MYFVIKDEKVFDRYVIVWEKVSKISKKNLIVKLYLMKNI